MAVGASISLQVSASESKSGVTVGNALWSGNIAQSLTFGDGTTANKIDRVYVSERTVASATNDDIDVAGSLTSAIGTAFVAAEIVGIVVVNKPEEGVNTTSLTIGGSASGIPGYTSAVESISPGGLYAVISPDASGIATVTAGTGDILRITNGSGTSNTYQIAIFARSV